MKRLVTLLALFIALLVGSSASVQAQDYKTAVGLRLGYQYGLSIKHFFKPPWAFEFLVSTRGYNRYFGGTLTALFEYHGAIGSVQGLSWYAGGGLHISRWHNSQYRNRNWAYNRDYHMVIGLDGILGLEYKFSGAPIALSLDWKPEFDLVGGWWFGGDGLALTLRFCF